MDRIQTEDLIRAWQQPVYNLALHMLGNEADAQDATQDIFLLMVRDLRDYDPTRPMRPWLFTLAMNVLRKRLTRDAGRARREGKVAIPAAKVAKQDRLDQLELWNLLKRHVSELPLDLRKPVVLCYYQGQSQSEAAATLQLPHSTLRDRIAKALDDLRAALKGSGYVMAVPLLERAMASAPPAALPPGLEKFLMQLASAHAPAAGATAITGGAIMTMKTLAVLVLFLITGLGLARLWPGLMTPAARSSTSTDGRHADNSASRPSDTDAFAVQMTGKVVQRSEDGMFVADRESEVAADALPSTELGNRSKANPMPVVGGNSFNGTVVDSKTGAGIPNVQVLLFSSHTDAGGDVLAYLSTDKDGHCHVEGMPEYTGILIWAAGYGPEPGSADARYYQYCKVRPLHVTAKEDHRFSLYPQAGISGRILLAGRQPLSYRQPDLELNVGMVGGASATRIKFQPMTNDDGVFFLPVASMFETPFPWSVQVTVCYKSFEPLHAKGTIQSTEEICDLGDLVLQTSQVFEGRVLSPDRKAVGDCEIRVCALDNPPGLSVRSLDGCEDSNFYYTTVDAEGRFRLEGMDFDEGYLLILPTSFPPLAVRMQFRGQSEDLVVNPGDKASGWVRTAAGEGVRDVLIVARQEIVVDDFHFVFERECRSDGDGEFEVEGLARGSCDIFVDGGDLETMRYAPLPPHASIATESNAKNLVLQVQSACAVRIETPDMGVLRAEDAGIEYSIEKLQDDGQWQAVQVHSQSGNDERELFCFYLVQGNYRLRIRLGDRSEQCHEFTVSLGAGDMRLIVSIDENRCVIPASDE